MKKSYAIISQKGGTGKTTTAIALAAGLANLGQKVLLVDADAQGDSTFASNVDMEQGELALSAVMEKKKKIEDAICGTEAGYDLIPADEGMSFPNVSLIKVTLADIVEKVSNSYDYIVIDCPPNIGPITIQALEGVDEIVIPALADAFSLTALRKLAMSVHDARKKNRKLMIAGVLLNRVHATTNIAKTAVPDLKELAEMIGTRVFDIIIPDNTKLKEAQFARKSIFEYDMKGAGAEGFNKFIEELTGEKEHGKIKIARRGVQGKGKGKFGTTRSKKTGTTKKQRK